MPRTKNSKSKRRASAARTAEARRAQAARTAPADNPQPAPALGRDEDVKLAAAKNGMAGLVAARPRSPGNTGAAKAPAGAAPTAPSASTPDGAPGWAAKALAELLTVTYWLDPGEDGDPFSATIRFSGRRADVTGKPRLDDTFSQEETVEGIMPGSGPVAITAEVRDIHPGQWTVTARQVSRAGAGASRHRRASAGRPGCRRRTGRLHPEQAVHPRPPV